jgi:hypothetical protein
MDFGYFMIHRAIGIHLQKILPKFVPKTDAEVDALLDCKLSVYVVHIFAYFAYFICVCILLHI